MSFAQCSTHETATKTKYQTLASPQKFLRSANLAGSPLSLEWDLSLETDLFYWGSCWWGTKEAGHQAQRFQRQEVFTKTWFPDSVFITSWSLHRGFWSCNQGTARNCRNQVRRTKIKVLAPLVFSPHQKSEGNLTLVFLVEEREYQFAAWTGGSIFIDNTWVAKAIAMWWYIWLSVDFNHLNPHRVLYLLSHFPSPGFWQTCQEFAIK